MRCPLEVLEATFSENPVLTRDPWIIARRVAGVFLGLSGRCFVEADLVVGGSFGGLLGSPPGDSGEVWFGQKGAISKTRQFSLLIFFRTSVRTAVRGMRTLSGPPRYRQGICLPCLNIQIRGDKLGSCLFQWAAKRTTSRVGTVFTRRLKMCVDSIRSD